MILPTRYPRRIRAYGPAALLIDWEPRLDEAINRSVHAYAAALRTVPGVTECVPAYASLLVRFAPLRLTAYDLREKIYALRPAESPADEGRAVSLPVCYGPDWGADFTAVAETLHLRPRQLIDLHSSTDYRVYQLGYLPGFAFLGPTPAELHLPRRPTARPRVPAGSVGLADRQTGVYPTECPGGWHLIGRCPLPLLQRGRHPSVLRAGDRVRFTPIDAATFERLRKQPTAWPTN